MKFLVWATYNAYIIFNSYRPHFCASHCFLTFHMFVDELCLQRMGDNRTAVHRRKAREQQSDLLHMQGKGQHHPECSLPATCNNVCLVCYAKYNKYLMKHPATAYGNMPQEWSKTTFWCSTCLHVSSTCWSDYCTKVQFWRLAENKGLEPSQLSPGQGGQWVRVLLQGNFTTHSQQARLPARHCLHLLQTASDMPRTIPHFTMSSVVGGDCRGALPLTPSQQITLDQVFSPLSLAVSILYICPGSVHVFILAISSLAIVHSRPGG